MSHVWRRQALYEVLYERIKQRTTYDLCHELHYTRLMDSAYMISPRPIVMEHMGSSHLPHAKWSCHTWDATCHTSERGRHSTRHSIKWLNNEIQLVCVTNSIYKRRMDSECALSSRQTSNGWEAVIITRLKAADTLCGTLCNDLNNKLYAAWIMNSIYKRPMNSAHAESWLIHMCDMQSPGTLRGTLWNDWITNYICCESRTPYTNDSWTL